MPSHQVPNSRVRRTVNDMILAQMLLVQATIESATVIGDGITELGKQIRERNDISYEAIPTLLQRIADDVVEPYTSRYQYFRDMLDAED